MRVTRVVSAIAAGRIINAKTAASQITGGVVWGISQALHEETYTDHALGRFMNHDLADYHVAVNADIHAIDVIFVDEDDRVVSRLGAKGSARSASSACRQRSRTRSSTPPASACEHADDARQDHVGLSGRAGGAIVGWRRVEEV